MTCRVPLSSNLYNTYFNLSPRLYVSHRRHNTATAVNVLLMLASRAGAEPDGRAEGDDGNMYRKGAAILCNHCSLHPRQTLRRSQLPRFEVWWCGFSSVHLL